MAVIAIVNSFRIYARDQVVEHMLGRSTKIAITNSLGARISLILVFAGLLLALTSSCS